MADSNWVGDPSKTHPIPLRLRNCNITKVQGGAFGWRGRGYGEMRKRVLYLSGMRSSATGAPQSQVTLEVDHIIPYRVGGVTSHTNAIANLRILDTFNNSHLDYSMGFGEKRRKRRLKAF